MRSGRGEEQAVKEILPGRDRDAEQLLEAVQGEGKGRDGKQEYRDGKAERGVGGKSGAGLEKGL